MQEDINPDDFDKDQLFAIEDFKKLTIELRREAMFEYICENMQYSPNLKNIFTGDDSDIEVLDLISEPLISINETEELIKENLKKEDGELVASINILIDITEKIKKRVFINTCRTLEKEGVLEMTFDAEIEDFSWRIKKDG